MLLDLDVCVESCAMPVLLRLMAEADTDRFASHVWNRKKLQPASSKECCRDTMTPCPLTVSEASKGTLEGIECLHR